MFTLVFWLLGQGILRKCRKDKLKLEITSLNLRGRNKLDEYKFVDCVNEVKAEVGESDDSGDDFKRSKEGCFSWMCILWKHTQADVINSVGLDSAIYLQFLKYCAIYFFFSSFICSFLLHQYSSESKTKMAIDMGMTDVSHYTLIVSIGNSRV